ncbi:aldehyde dehydrogenase family protein [Halarchaeum nitratireducens]|uniref:Aldehyde dehydrogenase DhaS n=1 Tax=Halarchaeum nitratireducens TaxID=489913 RepID=A0A830G8U8_9EURY|nr:aldehyde dehydrogenase family protein [Halarchaeum nitratireducens]GGN09410.1 putative aldehyde dehydrogenase DhaS [Halarchaeum nitratireducens]
MADGSETRDRHESEIRSLIGEREFGNYVGGETVLASAGATFAPEDPTIAEPIMTVPESDAGDVDDAVAAASDAFAEWRALTPLDRGDVLREWSAVLRDHHDELARLTTLEVGKPIAAAREDVETGIRFVEYYASVAAGKEGRVPDGGTDALAYVEEEPYGVTGQILPWNYPLLLLGWKVGAALATGNTCVVKPAEQTPLATIRAAQLSAGVLPDGVLNVVNGSGETGAAVSGHDAIRKVSFTGSVPVGREVMRAAADDVTPVTLELGGKNPFLVFPDADVEDAAETAAAAGLYNNGQSCDSGTRLLVHEDVEAEFLDVYLDAVASRTVGDPFADVSQGPLCHREHWESVRDYVELGKSEGATLLAGGGRPTDAPTDGYYVEPTVFGDVEPGMRIAQEEVFGPVQFVMTFSEYEEAIEVANGTEYGLASGVFTRDVARAHRIASDLDAGSVWVNHYFGTVPGTPFGGFKQSGIGRECGSEALDEYTQSKSVRIALDR